MVYHEKSSNIFVVSFYWIFPKYILGKLASPILSLVLSSQYPTEFVDRGFNPPPPMAVQNSFEQ